MTTPVNRALGIDPTPRGFGFALLEGPANLVDWGVKSVRRNKRQVTLAKVSDLIQQFRPEVIVMEDCKAKGARRSQRIRLLIQTIRETASSAGVRTRVFSQAQVKKAFAAFGAKSKHEIAQVIARQFPELVPWLPRYRQPWMTEDYRMAFFDATALVIAFFDSC